MTVILILIYLSSGHVTEQIVNHVHVSNDIFQRRVIVTGAGWGGCEKLAQFYRESGQILAYCALASAGYFDKAKIAP
jgi:hypothetical protein